MTLLPTRPLGRRGPETTRIGLGLAALGRPAYHNLRHGDDVAGHTAVEDLEAHTHRVLDAAWAAGVRTFDVARSYGRGEAFLQAWLEARTIPEDAVLVSSKWGYTYTADWRTDVDTHEVKDHSLATFTRQQGETLALLGPWLKTYAVHSATLDSGVFERPELLDALWAWSSEHDVRLGLTVSGPRQADVVRRALDVRGGALFAFVQATYNLLDPSVGPALQEAHDAGWGVVVKEGVANGRLTARTDLPDVAHVLGRVADALGTTPDAVALAAILDQPWADVVLSGAATIAHLQSNLDALEVSLTDDARDRLASLARTPDAYWQARSQLAWT